MKSHNGWWLLDHEEDDGYNKWTLEKNNWQNNLAKEAAFCSPGDRVAIDVGACYGAMSHAFAEFFDKVHAFEIIPTFIEPLKKNLENTPNVEIHNTGLYHKKHTVIARQYSYSGYSKIYSYESDVFRRNTKLTAGQRVISDNEVDVLPLDDFKIKNVDLIKIDAEGTEGLILIGAMKTINKYKPLLLVEVGAKCNREPLRWMLEDVLGYNVIKRKRRDWFCLPKEKNE